MNLQELLDYTGAQWLDDRTDLVDGDSDSLWSDEYLVRQFNEAQNILARRAWVIQEEGVAPAGRITLAEGVAVYPLHKSVLRVRLATPTDQEWPLWRTSEVRLRTPRPYSDAPFDVNNLSTPETGRPIAFATDGGTKKIRFFRTPSTTENGLEVLLSIVRLPITPLTTDNMDGVPEVPEEYHDWLCKFAAGRALTLPNVDGAQKVEGRALLDEFATNVKEARQDRQRAEMEPAAWGFSSATALLDGAPG